MLRRPKGRQEFLSQLEIPLQPGCVPEWKVDRLSEGSAKRYVERPRMLHLQRAGDHHRWVPADPNSKFKWRETLELVAADVFAHLQLDSGQVSEPLFQALGRVDPREIDVTIPVSEPPAHLHQGVVV